jgi:hypothetical protein
VQTHAHNEYDHDYDPKPVVKLSHKTQTLIVMACSDDDGHIADFPNYGKVYTGWIHHFQERPCEPLTVYNGASIAVVSTIKPYGRVEEWQDFARAQRQSPISDDEDKSDDED